MYDEKILSEFLKIWDNQLIYSSNRCSVYLHIHMRSSLQVGTKCYFDSFFLKSINIFIIVSAFTL